MSANFYVVSARRADSVSHAIKAHFTGPEDINLIVSKGSHLEIHVLLDDPNDPTNKVLRLLMDVPIYGRIATMGTYRPQERRTDSLFITTGRQHFFILSYNPNTRQLVTEVRAMDIRERTARPIETAPIGIVEPDGRMIGLHMYQGLLQVVELVNPEAPRSSLSRKHTRDKHYYKPREIINMRLEELCIISMHFMQSPPDAENQPMLAVLHQDTKEHRHLKVYIVDMHMQELTEYKELSHSNVDQSAHLLIPIPRVIGGGVIIVGEQKISCITPKGVNNLAIQPTIMRCWNMVDPEGTRYILGDYLGRLYALVLYLDADAVRELVLQDLGEVSQPSAIAYLDSGYTYIGSHFGDSQLILLSSDPNMRGDHISVKQEFENLAPMTDFCVVDIEKQGQGQVVACCGGFKDGSLRVVRNGIGIEVLGTLNDVPELTGIWALRSSFDAECDDTLVLSFISETRLQAKDEEGDLCPVEELDAGGFRMNETTLACANVIGDHVIQVTSSGAILLDCKTRAAVSTWTPVNGFRVNHAAVGSQQAVLALTEGRLVTLEVRETQLVETGNVILEHEISCLSLGPQDSRSPEPPQFCLVGLWTDMSLRLLGLPSLIEHDKQLLGTETIPRSVLLATLGNMSYAMAALGDGQLFTFEIDFSQCRLLNRKKISLGNQPIALNTFRSKGAMHVFAASDRPTVIHMNNGKLLYSNVNLKEVTHMCPFNYEEEALALVTEGALKVGTVEAIEKLHIKKIPLGESARRIAHQEESRTFGVLTVKNVYNENTGEEEEQSFLKILDDRSFDALDEFQMDVLEHVQSILSVKFVGDPTAYYCVGTAFVLPLEDEPTKGRILVFGVSEDRKLRVVYELQTSGSVYCMAPLSGRLLAGVNSKVRLFKWETSNNTSTMSLVEKTMLAINIVVFAIAVRGHFVLVGDLMKSISVLSYDPERESLELIARDYETNWITAVEALDDDIYLGTENSHHLLALTRQSDAAAEEERKRLLHMGRFHIGELVNRIRHGSLVMCSPDYGAIAKPELLYCTVNGGLGVIATLEPEIYNILSDVQDNLRRIVKGVGGLRHELWRRFENGRREIDSENFIDGDLLESFLDLTKEQQQAVVDGRPLLPKAKPMKKIDITVEELSRMMEELSRIH